MMLCATVIPCVLPSCCASATMCICDTLCVHGTVRVSLKLYKVCKKSERFQCLHGFIQSF